MHKLRFFMPIGLLAIVAGGSAIVMLLWNWLMPSIFGLGTISFWQALGICILCRILFGKFDGAHHKMHKRHGLHSALVREKWLKMTPEQRDEFINRRKAHFTRDGFCDERHFDSFRAEDHAPKDHE